jgi:two-component system KDP operon response regulator KdpE
MSTEASKAEILVVDDEIQIRRLLSSVLTEAGYTVRTAETGKAALAEAAARRPDVIILDLGLPDVPGIEVLKQLREWSHTPVLILSVFGEEQNKVVALDAGAEDYLTKPFGESELLARLRVLLRRTQPADETSPIRFGAVEVDLVRRLVTKNNQTVKLTAKEYALLRLFIVHRGKVLTHRLVLSELWGPKSEDQTHYLHVYLTRLRQKLEDEPNSPQFFQTEPGIGYRFTG